VIGLIVDTLTLCAFVPERSHRKNSSVNFLPRLFYLTFQANLSFINSVLRVP